MPRYERNGSRKPRELARHRTPLLGYCFIVTDTKETEQNYMYGLRDSKRTTRETCNKGHQD